MKKIIILALLLAGGFWVYQNRFVLPELKDQISNIAQEQKIISLPGPLRLEIGTPQAFLTETGTILATNNQRQSQGLLPLSANAKLATAASVKVNDMFSRQYFEHVAPDGTQASDLASDARYEYIAIGENLALGNYENDEVLVQAWMDSPGHRANILNKSYTEIGVAVKKGSFEGKTTWLAVQIFGKPLSACPSPQAALKARIDLNNQKIQELKQEIEARRGEVDTTDREEVEEYNGLIAEHNRLVEENRILVEQYNQQVAAFNACAKS